MFCLSLLRHYKTATGEDLVVQGKAVELHTADGRTKVLRAAGTPKVALAPAEALGARAWIAPGGNVDAPTAGRRLRNLQSVPVSPSKRSLLNTNAGPIDTVTFAPTLAAGASTGGGCSGADPIDTPW